MKRAAVKSVPNLPDFEQKQSRMVIAQEMLMTFNDDSELLNKVITEEDSCKGFAYYFLRLQWRGA